MENTVSINHTKENTIEFDISVEGVDVNDIKVRFAIETEQMILVFNATKSSGSAWKVVVPELPILKKTTYQFHVEVVTDGYYFQPAKGIINVIGSPELYSSKPKNITLEPSKNSKESENKEEPKQTNVQDDRKESKTDEKEVDEGSIELLARKLMSEQRFSDIKIEEKIAEIKQKTTSNSKDEQVRKILEEAGLSVSKKSMSSLRR